LATKTIIYDLMKIGPLTPKSTILDELGRRLTEVRKAQGHSQDALAKAAGIGVATLRRIEDGRDSNLGSWIKILKALGMDAAVDGFLPEAFASPMSQAQKARRRRRPAAGESSGSGFAWGDER